MSRADQGRIPIVDPNNPQCWGRDDLTGLPVMHPDMVKYMEYYGNGSLLWTGMMSHEKDVDQPNPQNVPPRLKPDPVPIMNPRYLKLTDALPIPQNVEADNIGFSSADITWTIIPGSPMYNLVWTGPSIAVQIQTAAPPYTITGLIPNTTYNVFVASMDGVAQSAYSEPILFTTL